MSNPKSQNPTLRIMDNGRGMNSEGLISWATLVCNIYIFVLMLVRESQSHLKKITHSNDVGIINT